MKKLKNWDNKTWLSSKSYISQFNSFLERKNSWVWGKFNPDVLHKIYTAETDSGYIFEIDIHLKYQK